MITYNNATLDALNVQIWYLHNRAAALRATDKPASIELRKLQRLVEAQMHSIIHA